ncbi:pyridoxal phosphate-dependent transferase [Armillaria novae-zelandiae]|uniref:Pyridoxal phosphate-dependent transferase n=1 Tax=Armillaria novae-zelandiae TaxID=153914 RepID=A0AA39PQQ4_9AGAR|nr:pyridoxal phosphate-dependent transferase [Armillaria novae-zelandiae]
MTPRSALDKQLLAALKSRDERLIRRRLPDPSSSTSSTLIDFNTNDYLSLASSPVLRRRFLEKLQDAPDVLGSGGSRLLVNGLAHSALEARLAEFFDSPAALLFNSGFDANVGFFSCIPQPGDVFVYDEYIHASVHDGIRASRARDSQYSFPHNSVQAFRNLLVGLQDERPSLAAGESSVFVTVESLYSMDGTFAPLREFVEILEEVFPHSNGYLVVDEAHSTGIYGPQGRGRVAMLGLESRVFARLHTFGKALAATGAVLLTTPLIRDYMLNYARSLIYTTSLSFSNIIAADASFDMLVDGTAQILSEHLMDISWYFTQSLSRRLAAIPPDLLSLPPNLEASPIIPIMTSEPRPLSAFLYARGMNARPITWPTVPKGKDRVRVCLHANNSREDIDRLVNGMIDWAETVLLEQRRISSGGSSLPGVLVASKL